jgi:hypothetical protein
MRILILLLLPLTLFAQQYTPVKNNTEFKGFVKVDSNAYFLNQVGIGTITPNNTLDVYGGMRVINGVYVDGLFLINQDSTLGLVQLGDYASDVHNTAIVIDDANQYVRISDSASQFQTQTFTIVNLNGAAQVGINTQTPTASLQVDGNASLGHNNTVSGSQYSVALGSGNTASATSANRSAIAIGSSSSVTGDYALSIGGKGNTVTGSGAIAIGSNITNNTIEAIMIGNSSNVTTFLNNGNVGIGTTTPSNKLEVNGTFQSTTDSLMRLYTGVQTLTVGGTQYSNPSAKCLGLVAGSNYVFTNGVEKVDPNLGGGVQSVMAAFDTLTFTGYSARVDSGKFEVNYVKFGTSTTHLYFDSTQIKLDSRGAGLPILLNPNSGDGNVGIGTASPSKKLEVNGSFIVTNSIYPNGLIRADTANNVHATLGDYLGDVNGTVVDVIDGLRQVQIGADTLIVQGSISRFYRNAGNPETKIAINTAMPQAVLDVVSANSGILFPRVANAAAVTSPVEGMVIYSLEAHKLQVYTGSTWETIISAP